MREDGSGVVAANGVGVDAFWQANLGGRSGVSRVDTFNTDEFAVKIGGQVRRFDPLTTSMPGARNFPRAREELVSPHYQPGSCAHRASLRS